MIFNELRNDSVSLTVCVYVCIKALIMKLNMQF